MPTYRVKSGKKFGPGGRYPAGTILELSEREAKPFSDILEPAPGALPGSTQALVPHETPQFQNEVGVEVPDDLKIMPGEIGHGEPFVSGEDEAEEESPKPRAKTKARATRKGATEE